MADKAFSVYGNKISSLITDENSLKFSSQKVNTISEFQDAWNKKLSLSKKTEIKYGAIKSIRKEDDSKEIFIKYKTWTGIPNSHTFSFSDVADYEIFFNFLEKGRYFKRTHERLTPLKASSGYLIGLIFTISITVFVYYQAVKMANGAVDNSSSGKVRAFNYLIGLLGPKGVFIIGGLISLYLLYEIWKRISRPPDQTKFLPPN